MFWPAIYPMPNLLADPWSKQTTSRLDKANQFVKGYLFLMDPCTEAVIKLLFKAAYHKAAT